MGYPFVNPYLSQLQMQPQMQPQIQPQMQPQMQPATYTNGKVWVSGEAGAKAYLVAPNSDVTLWDSEAQVIYLKAADASGMPSMKILDYTIRGAETPKVPLEEPMPINPNEYVLKADFDSLRDELEAVKEQIKHVPRQQNRPKPKGESKL